MGSLFLYFVIFFIRVFIFAVLFLILKVVKNGKLKEICLKYKKSLQENLFFEEILILIIEGYVEIYISSYLAIIDDKQVEILSLILAYIGFAFIIVLLILMIWMLC